MDFNDVADLLGTNEMPVRQHGALQVLRALFNVMLALSAAVALIVAFYNGHAWLSNWREYNYKKSVRRKYGIPDDDNDPFNVAYAKVQARRKEMTQKKAPQQPSSMEKTTPAALDTSSERQGVAQTMPRRRMVPTAADSSQVELPGGNSKLFTPQQSTVPKTPMDAETPKNPRAVHKAKPDVAVQDYAAIPSQRKRSLEKDGEDESSKKSRNDRSEQAEPTLQNSTMDVTEDQQREHATTARTRGAKRQAASDEEIASVGSIGKKAGKRVRRQSRKLAEVINVDENDEQMDIDHVSRGKKRDRVEAGSSFGGDDDMTAGDRGRKTRRQKRKSSVAVDMQGATPARGTKRSYEVESTVDSDEEGSAGRARSPRKRGKRMTKEYDSPVMESVGTSIGGRKIGEEWHANGVTYKVGDDGCRLRQALLRKRASRFSMPEDSQHPDSQARLEILVETWLNDDEYKAAEKRGDIYIPNRKSKKQEEPISESGKPLLWSSKQTGATLMKKAFIEPIVLNRRVAVDPFDHPSLTGNAKRVSIGVDSPVEPPTGSPSPAIRPSKSYSKWEKQDLEAEAMARLRKKLEEEKKIATPPPVAKKVSFQIPSPSAQSPTPAPSVSTSSSAPTSLPASAESGKAGAATAASARNLFAPPANAGAAKAAGSSTNETTATGPTQIKPPTPTITLTPPQPSKESSTPSSAPKFMFGSKPVSTQVDSTSTENKMTKPANQPTGPTNTSPSMPSAFGQKIPGTSNAAAGSSTSTMFTKPAAGPSNAVSSAPNGASGSASTFSFGIKGAAQGEMTTGTPPLSFGKPTEKTVLPTPSPLGAPAKDAITAGTSSAPTAGGPTGTTPQFSFGAITSKPAELSAKLAEQSTAGNATTAPKFNFGFGSRPVASPLTNQATTAAAASKPTTSTPAFGFGSNPASQNAFNGATTTSTSSSAASAPKFSFGLHATQTPTTMTQAPPSSTSNTGGVNIGTDATNSTTSSAPASTGLSFKFGAPSAAGSSSSSSPFGNMTSNPSPFGQTTSTPSPFGTTTKPSGTSASPFGATTSAFGNTSNATASSSPFGQPAKPVGETPTATFGFGSNNTIGGSTSTASTGDKQQENKPAFSFNFGASSTPAFGSTTAPSSASNPSPFGNAGGAAPAFTFGAKPANSPFGALAGSGNTNSNNTNGTNVFGSNTGPSVFGQKP